MKSSLVVWASALFPIVGLACDSTDRHVCQEQIVALVSYRTEAIGNAFGDLSALLPAHVQIRFVEAKDPEYAQLTGGAAYDSERHTLLLERAVLGAKLPNPLRWAASYWPIYEVAQYRQMFPVVETIDNALWSAYLQEASKTHGLTWPHKECGSIDVSKRLPCEMLTRGIAHYVRTGRNLVFNENRLDRIWPDDFSVFRRRAWSYSTPEYLDVQRYGGILLVRPLLNEFGAPRALAYIAQTPFDIVENSVRISALRYQDQARNALRVRAAQAETVARHVAACSHPTYCPSLREAGGK